MNILQSKNIYIEMYSTEKDNATEAVKCALERGKVLIMGQNHTIIIDDPLPVPNSIPIIDKESIKEAFVFNGITYVITKSMPYEEAVKIKDELMSKVSGDLTTGIPFVGRYRFFIKYEEDEEHDSDELVCEINNIDFLEELARLRSEVPKTNSESLHDRLFELINRKLSLLLAEVRANPHNMRWNCDRIILHSFDQDEEEALAMFFYKDHQVQQELLTQAKIRLGHHVKAIEIRQVLVDTRHEYDTYAPCLIIAIGENAPMLGNQRPEFESWYVGDSRD